MIWKCFSEKGMWEIENAVFKVNFTQEKSMAEEEYSRLCACRVSKHKYRDLPIDAKLTKTV